MTRVTKDTLTAQVTALEAKVAALEAKLALARECWTNQRAKVADLEARLASRGRFVDVTPARAAYLARQAAKPAYVPLHERDPAMAALREAAMARGARAAARADADITWAAEA